VKITLSIDERTVARARKKAGAMGKSLGQVIGEYLEKLAENDAERSIKEFRELSGRGHSSGGRFNRDEIHGRAASARRKARRYRVKLVTDPATGLPALSAGPNAPTLTSQEVEEILSEFP
jgi:hypothetical protein